MADDTWLDTFETWGEYVSEYIYGPPPEEVIRRANASIRTAVTKLERERAKVFQHETQLFTKTKSQEKTARCFGDLRPGLLAIANARRSGSRIDKLVLKMRGLQQQLIETEAHSTTALVMHNVTHALAQASTLTGGLAGVQRAVMNYERQKAILEETQDSFAELDEDEEDEDVADEMLQQIAAEAHLNLVFELPVVATATRTQKESSTEEMDELMHRLAQLRK